MAAKKTETKPEEAATPVVPVVENAPPTPAEINQGATAEAAAAGAEAVTAEAAAEGRLPEEMAVANPEPATEMESPSGAFIETEIKQAIPVEHPSLDNNPRAGTSAVQNGGDFNDPNRVHPQDPDFVGQGLDLSVYGKTDQVK